MSALRLADKAIMELVVQLHWIASREHDPVIAIHLRKIADHLDDAAKELRELWQSDFAGLLDDEQ